MLKASNGRLNFAKNCLNRGPHNPSVNRIPPLEKVLAVVSGRLRVPWDAWMVSYMMLLEVADLRVADATEVAHTRLELVVGAEVVL